MCIDLVRAATPGRKMWPNHADHTRRRFVSNVQQTFQSNLGGAGTYNYGTARLSYILHVDWMLTWF